MTINRRHFLKGLGGVTVGLPLLEGLRSKALARDAGSADPFVIFFRQPNGVAAEQNTDIGAEPERFWPRELGALTPENVSGRALAELNPYLNRTLVVGNVNHNRFDYGDGHAQGAIQALTARGPMAGTSGGDSEADGESIDMFIARQLNSNGADSTYLHVGGTQSWLWLGGACISHRAAGVRHSATSNPYLAFQNLFGEAPPGEQADLVNARRRSAINDLVREQLNALRNNSRLSAFDRSRLNDHFEAIRELEVAVTCQRDSAEEAAIEAGAGASSDPTGDDLMRTIELQNRVAALAVACGLTRSVVIQIGAGNGSDLRFTNPEGGALMENFHFISHRRASHSNDGDIISGADLLHHRIDQRFAQGFRHLLDSVSAFDTPEGGNLLDSGVCAWYNDNSNGPQHCVWDSPWILSGGANGFFKQGQYLEAEARSGGGRQCSRSADQAQANIQMMLNTIATAVGCRKDDGSPIDNFGDPSLRNGLLSSLMA